MAASAPFASPYRAICLSPQYLPASRTRHGKRLSDITLEGTTFRMSFLNHQTVRETPKKQLQRIYTVPDSLARTANLPVLAPVPDAWSASRGLQTAAPSQSRRPRSSSGISGRSVSTSQSAQLRPLTAPRALPKQEEDRLEQESTQLRPLTAPRVSSKQDEESTRQVLRPLTAPKVLSKQERAGAKPPSRPSSVGSENKSRRSTNSFK